VAVTKVKRGRGSGERTPRLEEKNRYQRSAQRGDSLKVYKGGKGDDLRRSKYSAGRPFEKKTLSQKVPTG